MSSKSGDYSDKYAIQMDSTKDSEAGDSTSSSTTKSSDQGWWSGMSTNQKYAFAFVFILGFFGVVVVIMGLTDIAIPEKESDTPASAVDDNSRPPSPAAVVTFRLLGETEASMTNTKRDELAGLVGNALKANFSTAVFDGDRVEVSRIDNDGTNAVLVYIGIFKGTPDAVTVANRLAAMIRDGTLDISPYVIDPGHSPDVSVEVPQETQAPEQFNGTGSPCIGPPVGHEQLVIPPSCETETPHDDPCFVICDTGFEMDPARPPTCNNGTWVNIPTCLPRKCNELPLSSNLIDSNPSNPVYRTGATVTYTCENGYSLEGERDTRCLATGRWSLSPLPTCRPKKCVNATSIANGRVSAPSADYDTFVTYTCDPGYELTGNSNPDGQLLCNGICAETCAWDQDPAAFSCIPAPCNTDPIVNNSDPLRNCTNGGASSVPSGGICDVWCQDEETEDIGYVVVGNRSARCVAGEWVYQPTCEPKGCSLPPKIPNSDEQALEACSDKNTSDTCTVSCNPGYTPSHANATCLAGAWQNTPNCDPNPCEPYPISNGNTVPTSPAHTGDTRQLVCNDGFELPPSANSTASCVANEATATGNSWDNAATCRRKRCPDLPALAFGSIAPEPKPENNGSYVFEDSVTFSCDSGYDLKPPAPGRLCTANGTWHGGPLNPVCSPRPCDALTELNLNLTEAGQTNCAGTQSSVRCFIQCIDGYELSGEAPLCSLGNWSNPDVNCQRIPTAPPQSSVEATKDTGIFGSLFDIENKKVAGAIALAVGFCLCCTCTAVIRKKMK